MIGRPARLLVVVAHPDDETFGLGSVIASSVEQGVQVTVCCATRGEAGEAHGLDPAADLGEVREAELHAAAHVLGVSRVVLLDYADSGMSGEPGPATLAGAPFDAVVAEMRSVVDQVRPDVVVTSDPEHGDGHRDHEVIARATLVACRDLPDVRVYAWALTRPLLARWFAELQGVRPDSAHLELDQQGLGRPEHHITTILDVAHLQPTREHAIALHRSQISPYDGMSEQLRTAFLQTDRLVRLMPPWPGGEPERGLF